MWNDAYSYVRLHQPYRLFTTGNIAWTLGRERSYLATRGEVAAHLRHCFDVISKRLDVDARWGWECLDHTEDERSIVVSARGPDGEVCSFTADRFIDATGFDVEPIDPLPLASRRVRSISPQQLEDSGLLSDDHTGPVWVIGSGKTAMDTIVALVRAKPGAQDRHGHRHLASIFFQPRPQSFFRSSSGGQVACATARSLLAPPSGSTAPTPQRSASGAGRGTVHLATGGSAAESPPVRIPVRGRTTA